MTKISKDFFAEWIENLVFQWEKCILKNRVEIEKWSKDFFPGWNVNRFIVKFCLFIE